MLHVTLVVQTQCCGPFLPKPQPASNRVPLRQRRCMLGSSPKAEGIASEDSLSALRALSAPHLVT